MTRAERAAAGEPTPVTASVVVPTRNSMRTLAACLRSIRAQDVPVELIVVDNASTDGTYELARELADTAVRGGPERSAQRNTGVRLAAGGLGAVGRLGHGAAADDGVGRAGDRRARPAPDAVAVPGGQRRPRLLDGLPRAGAVLLRRRPGLHNPRLLRRELLLGDGAFDPAMAGPEDTDLRLRLRPAGTRIALCPDVLIVHDEGRLTLRSILAKRVYYGRSLPAFAAKNPGALAGQGAGTLRALVRHRRRLARHPVHTAGLLVLRAAEAGAYAVGYRQGRRALRAGRRDPAAALGVAGRPAARVGSSAGCPCCPATRLTALAGRAGRCRRPTGCRRPTAGRCGGSSRPARWRGCASWPRCRPRTTGSARWSCARWSPGRPPTYARRHGLRQARADLGERPAPAALRGAAVPDARCGARCDTADLFLCLVDAAADHLRVLGVAGGPDPGGEARASTPELFRPAPEPVAEPVLAFVSPVAANKGIDRVLAAFALVRAKIPEARLLVLGDGPLVSAPCAGRGVELPRPRRRRPGRARCCGRRRSSSPRRARPGSGRSSSGWRTWRRWPAGCPS